MKILNTVIITLLFSVISLFASERNVHSFSVNDINGNKVNLSDYSGKTLLIVNVASKCGFTFQYEGLQKLYDELKDSNFVILAFPCNQFADQEPGTNEEIKEFCSSTYGVTFPMFDKIDVNGENADPLYQYLVEQKGFEGFDESKPRAKMIKGVLEKHFPESLKGNSIKWNFTKFLVDKNGNVVERFETPVTPEEIKPEIEKLLNN